MGLNTLLGQPSPEQLKALPGRIRNPERIKQHLDAFALHLQGVSYRGIQDHFGWKSLSTAQNSVKRGEELAKQLNLDGERIRLKLAAFFDEILDITLANVRDQAREGQITQVADNDGNRTVTKRNGVDPRLLGEAGRGAIRFAQFVGLMDADSSTDGGQQMTLIQLQAPTDGASFADRWGSAETVDVSAAGQGSGQTQGINAIEPSVEGGSQ